MYFGLCVPCFELAGLVIILCVCLLHWPSACYPCRLPSSAGTDLLPVNRTPPALTSVWWTSSHNKCVESRQVISKDNPIISQWLVHEEEWELLAVPSETEYILSALHFRAQLTTIDHNRNTGRMKAMVKCTTVSGDSVRTVRHRVKARVVRH